MTRASDDQEILTDKHDTPLRPCTNHRPVFRSYRGVSYEFSSGVWRARIYCLGKHMTLGRFRTAIEAASLHDRAAVYIHGDRAPTNFGVERARQSNESGPISASWRIMSTLEVLARENRARLLAFQSGKPPPGCRSLQSWGEMVDYGQATAAERPRKKQEARTAICKMSPISPPSDVLPDERVKSSPLQTRGFTIATLYALVAIGNRVQPNQVHMS
jgi:AP2 domain